MNFYKHLFLLLLACNLTSLFAIENSSHFQDPLEQILKTDDLPAFLEFTKGHKEATDKECYHVALIHKSRTIASYYKAKLSQVQINSALLVMINRHPSLKGAQLAVEMGADINYRPDSCFRNPLESALDEEEYEIADFLFAKGARLPARVIIRPCSRGKPLERAIIHSLVNSNYMEVRKIYNNLSWLLEKGYDPDDAGDMKRTALFDANRPKIIRLLCQYGADPNSVDENGWSPLLRLYGDTPKHALKTAIVLAHFGADIHYQHPKSKQTILHVAANRGLIDVVAYFLIKGVNKQIQNASGLLPVELVTNNPDLTTMLLSDQLPHMPAEALRIEEKLQKLKQKIA
jgi:hypothetical protein